jgi:hypothetical protein
MIDAVYSNAVGIIDEDHPLAKPENRHLLSEAQDSEDEENGV